MSLSFVNKSFMVRKTAIEMLQDRGYEGIDPGSNRHISDIAGDSLDIFRSEYQGNPLGWSFSCAHRSRVAQTGGNPSHKEVILVRNVRSFNREVVDTIRSDINERTSCQYDRLICIIHGDERSDPSAPTKTYVTAADKIRRTHGIVIETFLSTNLLINISKHVLVPRHVLLSREEKAAMAQQYKVTDAQIPIIEYADPMARYLGLLPGDVVIITRPSETAGKYVSYRICR